MSMNTIDIDVGGTFTDMVLNYNGKTILKKTPTTPHDLSACFLNVIEEAGKELEMGPEELLPEVGLVRYSTTVAMNRLIERKGPRLGLIATEGHEDAVLIGKGAQWVDGTRVSERRNLAPQKKPEPLISRELIVGVKERVDSFGQVIRPLDEEDVRQKVRYLVDQGVRGFVVSLLWSPVNPSHERRIKQIIREEYKEYTLGYMPVVLASDVIGRSGEYQRSMTAILDAYLFRAMQMELAAMWDRLRDYQYKGPLMMVHNSGGMAEVFKTDAVRTYSAGPVAALIGSHKLAQGLGYKNVIACDVGGTSFDIGLVVDQSVRNYDFRPILDRWMVGISMLQTMSIGAGGGSIASVNKMLGNRVEVGPQSAGAYPGPACYDQGGEEPTVTDADLVLGYLDEDYYFGGQMLLNKKKAEETIKSKIADPLGVSVEEAAILIRKIVDENMGTAIRKEIHLRGYDPRDFVLFAIGGGGPTHVAGYMGDIPTAVVFPFSPVFSAHGSSVMDVMHIYENSRRFVLMEPGTRKFGTNYDDFNGVVDLLIERAKKELAGEGMPVDDAVFRLELDMLYGGQVHRKRSSSPVLHVNSEADMKAVYDEFEQEFSNAFSPLVCHPDGGVYVESFVLTASIPTEVPDIPEYPVAGPDPSEALRTKRPCFWGNGGFEETLVYDYSKLKAGNQISGPSILETEYTTLVVPPGYICRVDEHLFARIERA
ncbi:MAG: hydantoinase/oxoprolinase family protein [SAR324 cluster bacterium]|nr:acetophenone carboxylase [Deltaproteobacteria bacterium]MDP6248607.1 hydantoinase/oxoprolinase family protein [SAR324 cluster bacterium]MDP6464767.1 hydantoinase/oxoprolinase family protein [SAR324 cluster bacterium]MDP7140278.1 hydantoinase/oxoprolinase family protein [SAR324 cluster bacterium]MDP7334365.1 hydantoinase/oxoprolinase family protein [SAR324 cluster bacterium]